MSKLEVLLLLHLLGVFALLMGFGLNMFLGISLTKATAVSEFASSTKLMGTAGKNLIRGGAVLLLVAGLALVEPSGHEFEELWVGASVVLWIIAIANGESILGPHAKAIGMKASKLMADGVTESEELQAMANSKKIMITGNIQLLLILSFLALMVFKPGA